MQFHVGQSVAVFRRGNIVGRGTVEKLYANGGARISLGGGKTARVSRHGIETGGLMMNALSVEPWDTETHALRLRERRERAALAALVRRVDEWRDKIPADKLDEAISLARKLQLLVAT